jgi:hypothetical protein
MVGHGFTQAHYSAGGKSVYSRLMCRLQWGFIIKLTAGVIRHTVAKANKIFHKNKTLFKKKLKPKLTTA